MGHGLQENDHMALAGNVAAWHGLGTLTGDDRDPETLHRAAKLDWKVAAWAKQAVNPDDESELLTLPSRAIVRLDTKEVLAEVGTTFTIVQNEEAKEFAKLCLRDDLDYPVEFETAGSLFNGRKVWYLACIGDDIEVPLETLGRGNADSYKQYLLVVNRHDGKGSFLALTTGVKVVCQNTMNFAIDQATNVFRIRHTPQISERIEDTQKALQIAFTYRDRFRELMTELEAESFERNELRDYAASVMSDMRTTLEDAKTRLRDARKDVEPLEADVNTIEHLFEEGPGNKGETKGDALNAITDFLDHHRRRYEGAKDARVRLEKRMDDTLWGDSARRKQRAVNLITRW